MKWVWWAGVSSDLHEASDRYLTATGTADSFLTAPLMSMSCRWINLQLLKMASSFLSVVSTDEGQLLCDCCVAITNRLTGLLLVDFLC